MTTKTSASAEQYEYALMMCGGFRAAIRRSKTRLLTFNATNGVLDVKISKNVAQNVIVNNLLPHKEDADEAEDLGYWYEVGDRNLIIHIL